MAIGNHRALALATKGIAYSDPLTKGVLVSMVRIYLEDGEIIIIKKGGGSESGPSVGLPDHLKLQPFKTSKEKILTDDEFLKKIKKEVEKRQKKIKELELVIVKKDLVKNFDITAELLESTLKASLIDEEIVEEKDEVKISIKLI